MVNFEWETPTKIIFGQGCLNRLGEETIRWGKKALLVYGKNRIKELGIYQQVLNQLKAASVQIMEHPGVKPNPILSHAEEGARKAREENVDVIVAVGGGSVIDESKGIAIGAYHTEPLWDFYLRKVQVRKALPLIAVQTFPATSSELNQVSVLTNDRTGEKFSVRSNELFPKVTFLDPTFTLQIPVQQTAYAVTDMLSHLMEGYFTQKRDFPVQDGLVEGMCRALMGAMETILEDPTNLDARSDLMWAGAWAWNGLLKAGVEGASIPNHMLEHPLSGLYDVPHGAGLSIIIPAWLSYKKTQVAHRILKYGTDVLRIADLSVGKELQSEVHRTPLSPSVEKAVDQVIQALVAWYRKIGTPTSLKEAGIPNVDLEKLTSQALELCRLWGISGYSAEDIRAIYQLAKG
ncbi:MAG: iron-containing alcohol dehydrogenase [Spirochaetes bacterium]|nr:iron-containing alcohol dehydrogenase [Spirochaetota bacterium]